MRWRDAIQPEAMACQSMQELTPQVIFIFFENQSEKKKEFSHAAIFEVNFCKKSGKVITVLAERTVDALLKNLESVA